MTANEPADLSWEETRHALIPLMRVHPWVNVLYVLREYLGLGAVLFLCGGATQSWLAGRLATPAFLTLAAAGVTAVAAFQHRLSGLAHDASHGTLFRHRLANELCSDLLLMFPLVAMTQSYRVAHLGHHRYVNDPERDPDLVRLNQPVPHSFPVAKGEFLRRYVLASFWPPSLLRYLAGRARAANAGLAGGGDLLPLRTAYPMRVARTMRGAYWLTVLAAVHAAGAWPVFFLFWVAPLLTVYPLFMQLREVAHHANAPDAGDLTNSRVFDVNPLLRACVFPYGQDFHLTHHLFAMVPHYRIARADAVLRRYPPYRETVEVCHGYFLPRAGTPGPTVLDVLARGLGSQEDSDARAPAPRRARAA